MSLLADVAGTALAALAVGAVVLPPVLLAVTVVLGAAADLMDKLTGKGAR